MKAKTGAKLMKKAVEDVVVVCRVDTVESRLICAIANDLNIPLVISLQSADARLEREPDLLETLFKTGRLTVWIFGIPGPEREALLRDAGFTVIPIDCRNYNGLDRAHDASGKILPSLIEQFLARTRVSDHKLQVLKHIPWLIRGLGIFEHRFAEGLRIEGYHPKEISGIIRLYEFLRKKYEVRFAEERAAAADAWKKRRLCGPYLVVESSSRERVRQAIIRLAISDRQDARPTVIAERGGLSLYVHNLYPKTVQALQKDIGPTRDVMVFGAGRHLAVDVTRSPENLSLEELLTMLAARGAP